MNNLINSGLLRGYESKQLKRYDDPIDTLPEMVSFEDLPNREINGVLLVNRHINGKLMQIYSKENTHELIISATGGGKSSSCVIPQVVSFGKQKVKKSMIISDPKGEIYKRTSKILEQEGYRVYLLNYRDTAHSEFWNPLTPIYRAYHKVFKIYDEIEIVQTENGYRNKFRGKIYNSQSELDHIIDVLFEAEMDKVGNMIDEIAGMMITAESTKEKTWEYGAMELLKAFLWGMLEDSRPTEDGKEPTITEQTFSLRTIFRIFATFRPLSDSSPDKGYFEDRSHDSNAFIFSRTAMDCARVTRSGYTSTFLSKMNVYKNAAVQTVTCCNSFEFDELVDGHVAVFIDYQDEIKTQYQLISLFVQNAYKFLIEQANKTPSGRLDVPFYFMLDEFGNFPAITDFDTGITAARGRNIYFCLVLQSYSQLEHVYGKETAEIIRDNLNVKIFLGSNNPNTLKTFQSECGDYTRLSPLTALNGNGSEITSYAIETIPIVTRSELSCFEPGECVITELNSPYTLWSKLERYFLCDEFKDLPLASEHEYLSKVNPYESTYIFELTKKMKSKSGFDF